MTQRLALFVLTVLAVPCTAAAQTSAPPAGSAFVTFLYQRIENTGHRRTNGVVVPRGTSLDMPVYVEIGYAVTDRLSFSAGLPYVFARYTDPNPPPPPIPFLPGDASGDWQSGWQDAGITARYNLVSIHGFGLTPTISFGAPTNAYNFRGETAIGRFLREVRLGIEVATRLDAISRHLSVSGAYSYALVEKPEDLGTNRSNASVEGDYRLTDKLVLRGQVLWQRTHGGLRFGSPPPADLLFPGEVNNPDLLFEHDRAMRDNYWHVGAGATYALNPVWVSFDYMAFVGGTDTHAGNAITLSVTIPFGLGRRR
jgi:hypothetical protein